MRFDIWLVVALALTPLLALFAGMSVAAGLNSSVDWEVIAAIVGGIAAAAYRAGRTAR